MLVTDFKTYGERLSVKLAFLVEIAHASECNSKIPKNATFLIPIALRPSEFQRTLQMRHGVFVLMQIYVNHSNRSVEGTLRVGYLEFLSDSQSLS